MIISQEINVCNFCGSDKLNFDEKRAEIYCRDCGSILSERMLWADIAEDVIYNTKIRELFFVMPNELRSLDERALIRVYNDLILIDNLLNLRRYVRKEVVETYMNLFKKDLTKRKNRMKLLGSLILIISRRDELPYLDEDIAFACYCDEKELLRTAKKVAEKLKVKIVRKKPSIIALTISHSLGLDARDITRCVIICEEILETGLMVGVKPENIAATSILLVSKKYKKKIDEKKIYDKLKVSKSTIYRLMSKLDDIDSLFLKII